MMNDGEGHLTAALPASENYVHTDGTEELSTSHELDNTRRSSRSRSVQNEDSLAGDSVRFDTLVELLGTDGLRSRDQPAGEDTAEVIHHPSPLLTPSGLPPLAQHSDPFQTPERRPDVSGYKTRRGCSTDPTMSSYHCQYNR